MSEKAHILIVDDNYSMARSIAMILEFTGYVVETAQNGQEAIEKVERTAFDVIFMDIKMPIMDGIETHRRIKAIRPHAVVVMMTAYALEDLIQQALQNGAYCILYKPPDIDRMLAIIEQVRTQQNGASILVVDDDPAICDFLLKVLTHKGHQVEVARSGEDAIAKVKSTHYEIIFIDMKMPTLNGLETYLAIREIDRAAVAIMITAYRQEMSELVAEALRNQAYDCLYKPIEIDSMLAIVDEICRGKADRLSEDV